MLLNTFKYPLQKEWGELLRRPTKDLRELEAVVREVLDGVRASGDVAVKAYTEKFDGFLPEEIQVSEEEMQQAASELSDKLKQAILTAKDNIEKFHAAQKDGTLNVETMPGVRCWRRSLPIEKVGLYIPGGTAPLFSTVLMLAVPANIAGCREIVLCTPPDKTGKINPAILFAAQACGVTKVFKVGGIQAIGAMAYGTESIPQVYKIFGPGNQYVTAAKQEVNRQGIAIDMPAGPSEVLVVADRSCNPQFVAADLLSQAEHGADSQVILLSWEEKIIAEVEEALQQQLEQLPRKNIAAEALKNSKAFLLENKQQAVEMVNAYAPEHLILSVQDELFFTDNVINAGSVFLGNWTPESAGDYASGTNHTLPTNGFARMYSGVSLDSFVKKVTYQKLTPKGILNLGETIEEMAAAEQLDAHKNAVTIRRKYIEQNDEVANW
jgi:histidinol dehydrogenase